MLELDPISYSKASKAEQNLKSLRGVLFRDGESLVLPLKTYTGYVHVTSVDKPIYTGTNNVGALLNLHQGTFTGNGLTVTVDHCKIHVVGTALSECYVGLNDGVVYTDSALMRSSGKKFTLPVLAYYLNTPVVGAPVKPGTPSFCIQKLTSGNSAALGLNTEISFTPDENFGQAYIYCVAGVYDMTFTVRLRPSFALSSGTYVSQVSVIESPGVYQTGDLTWSISADNELYSASSNFVVTGDTNEKCVWFGDSVSMLRDLPSYVEKQVGFDIIDCSVSGSPLTYSSETYQPLGFMGLVTAILSGDFTAQDTAVTALLAQGSTAERLKIQSHINTLKTVDFSTVNRVVLLAGTNDFTYSGSTVDQFKTAMDSSIADLLTEYPNISMYIITPIRRFDVTQNAGGETLLQYVQAEKETADKYALPCLDLYNQSSINSVNYGNFLETDKLHPNASGNALLAKKCSGFLWGK